MRAGRRQFNHDPKAEAYLGLAGGGYSRGQRPTRRLDLRHLGDHFFDDRFAERIEMPRHQHECAGAADDIVAIVIFQPARRIGVVGISGERRFAEDNQAVDGNALGQRLVARQRRLAAGIVGAVTGDIDGAAGGFERRLRRWVMANSIAPLIEVRSANERGASKRRSPKPLADLASLIVVQSIMTLC